MRLEKYFHRNPAERKLWEKVARRFILPPHSPRSLPLGRWGMREKTLKRHFPIRFWIWDTLPDLYSSNVTHPLRRTRQWFRYRFKDRYDVVQLELPKDYHEPDTRLLHANFQILKDFVEIELAAMHSAVEEDDPDTDEVGTFLQKFGKKLRRNRRQQLRQPEKGLAYLDWEISDTSGPQQTSAMEKKEIYLWWTQARPARVDLYDCELLRDPNENPDEDFGSIFNRPYNREIHERRNQLENFYHNEDEEMLIRLIKIRHSLWT